MNQQKQRDKGDQETSKPYLEDLSRESEDDDRRLFHLRWEESWKRDLKDRSGEMRETRDERDESVSETREEVRDIIFLKNTKCGKWV